jgi:site-specific recombinase XerD
MINMHYVDQFPMNKLQKKDFIRLFQFLAYLKPWRAFLRKEGKKIIQERQKDFQLIFLMKETYSYVFTAEANHSKQLDCVAITPDVNKVMREVSNQLPGKPKITSHSFRIGFIAELWKDSKDIEFVKQTIGHRKLDTTSAYVNKLSDQERQKRIDQLE